MGGVWWWLCEARAMTDKARGLLGKRWWKEQGAARKGRPAHRFGISAVWLDQPASHRIRSSSFSVCGIPSTISSSLCPRSTPKKSWTRPEQRPLSRHGRTQSGFPERDSASSAPPVALSDGPSVGFRSAAGAASRSQLQTARDLTKCTVPSAACLSSSFLDA